MRVPPVLQGLEKMMTEDRGFSSVLRAQKEGWWSPGLSFVYREATFFVRVLFDKLLLETADLSVGSVYLGDGVLLTAIANVLDQHICSPVQVTEYGDALVFKSGETDNDPLGTSEVAIHQRCKGGIDSTVISDTHKVLQCNKCNLRVPIPVTLKSIGDLRAWSQTLKGV